MGNLLAPHIKINSTLEDLLIDKILPGLGLLTSTYFSYRILRSFSKFIYNQIPRQRLIDRYGRGSYAVVTGASDGIGKAFCEELAKEGFNIILISRTRSKLEAVERRLREINKDVKTKTFIADFKDSMDQDFFEEIQRVLEGYDISILVNNVGVDNMRDFHRSSSAFLKDMIVVNMVPQTILTRRLIEEMVNRGSNKNKRSAIINLSSISAARPMPFFATYGATKSYCDFLSQALAMEMKDLNLDIISLKPGYVTTQLTHNKNSAIDSIKPNQCAGSLLKMMGKTRCTSGHWKHTTWYNLIESFSESIFQTLSPVIMRPEMERRESHAH